MATEQKTQKRLWARWQSRRPHSSTSGRGPSHVGGNVTGAVVTSGHHVWGHWGHSDNSDLALHINYVYILVVNVAYILTQAAHCVPLSLSHSVDMRCQGSIGQMADCCAGGMPIITPSISSNFKLATKNLI